MPPELLKIQELIKGKGACLSKDYINSRSYLEFKCHNGHYFKSPYYRIINGHWCSHCANNVKLTINSINEQLKHKHVTCISDIYLNNKEPLTWKCNLCDYQFSYNKNYMDRSFTQCYNCKIQACVSKIEERVKLLDGYWVEKNYSQSHQKLKFTCSSGHSFSLTYNRLINFQAWCPTCTRQNNLSEEICRAHFEQLLGYKFPSVRPNWLKKDNGYNLELDGYCAELNLAFEHQGIQHYQDIFNKLHQTQENDKLKADLCSQQGVKLIIIPQLFRLTKLSELTDVIIQECDRLNIRVEKKNIDYSACYKPKFLKKYQEIAASRGGKCLSTEYLGSTTHKLWWECRKKHRWEQFPYVIDKGHWCPICKDKNVKI
jgi:hypothetical protein